MQARDIDLRVGADGRTLQGARLMENSAVQLPGQSATKMYDNPVPIPGGFFSGTVFFPRDGVLARTVTLEMERGHAKC